MSSVYKVTVTLDDETLKALSEGFQMQVFKGVKSAAYASALPTVWLTVPQEKFSSSVDITWAEEYGGYFSHTMVQPGIHVDSSTGKPMEPGQTMILHSDGSSTVSSADGVPGAFTFESKRTETWTCGLMSKGNGGALSPVCAFPQYGPIANFIMPYQRILILFTQMPLSTGTIVKTAVTTSVTITLSPQMPTATVPYNINTGWTVDGSQYQTANPPHFKIASALIVPINS